MFACGTDWFLPTKPAIPDIRSSVETVWLQVVSGQGFTRAIVFQNVASAAIIVECFWYRFDCVGVTRHTVRPDIDIGIPVAGSEVVARARCIRNYSFCPTALIL